MDTLLYWIVNTEAGTTAARAALVLLGAGIMVNQMLLCAYVDRRAVPWYVAVLIVAGVSAGAGALHSGVYGNLPAGAVFSAASCVALIGMLVTHVGTPRRLSERYQACEIDPDLARTRAWWRDLADHAYDLKDTISDWGELGESRPKKGRSNERH